MRAVLDVILLILDLYWWIVIAMIIMSWLISFNVINTRNQFVEAVWRVLNQITEPILKPIRRLIPPVGGLDLSPLIVFVIIFAGGLPPPVERVLLLLAEDELLQLGDARLQLVLLGGAHGVVEDRAGGADAGRGRRVILHHQVAQHRDGLARRLLQPGDGVIHGLSPRLPQSAGELLVLHVPPERGLADAGGERRLLQGRV